MSLLFYSKLSINKFSNHLSNVFTASWQNSTPTRDEKIFSKYEGHIDLNYNLIIKML